MRVIAGTARSLPLKTPDGMDTRPTSDRIKETLFNMLQSNISDCVFVDMFAGSGGIGIEALSRGARKAYFIENAPKAISCIEQNLAFTKLDEHAIVIKQDVSSALYNIYEKEVDIVFIDPPYQSGLEKTILTLLHDMHYISDDTLIVIEAAIDTKFDFANEIGFKIVREKCYKTNKHVFLKSIRKEVL